MKAGIAVSTLLALCAAAASHAGQTDIHGPPGSVHFGTQVFALPNGNVVVTDPDAESANGYVHLYSRSGQRISTLRGAQANDRLGLYGVIVLPGGNFLVPNPGASNGSALQAGSVTWVNGSTGLNATVSAQNSLVGSHSGDFVGQDCLVLKNGNYLVNSKYWDRDKAGTILENAGAVTWGSGSRGATGPISTANSLVGRSAGDLVGIFATELANGHVAVNVPYWDGDSDAVDAGAVVWLDGAHGMVGEVSAGNALLGNRDGDRVGARVVPLTDGSYYVVSTGWSDGSAKVGALTWCAGTGPCLGNVSAANSVIGATAGDFAGAEGLALPNGKMLAQMPAWTEVSQNAPNAGAVTVLPADRSVVGRLNPLRLLHGAQSGDYAGEQAVLLDNGNAVVVSPRYNGGSGAVSFIDANSPATGTMSAINSLHTDRGGYGLYVLPLPGGRYVVACPYCDVGGVTDAGAVLWQDGTGSTLGLIDGHNTLHGLSTNDNVGLDVTVLSNGNYVVASPGWDNSILFPNRGAVTWVNGSNGVPRNETSPAAAVSGFNSLVGSSTNDKIGDSVTALSNGNYVVGSPFWANGSAAKAGAATWADGSQGISGYVTAANSLVGTSADDEVGNHVTALPNGNFVVCSTLWDEPYLSGAVVQDSGAATWGDGMRGIAGPVTMENSFLSNGRAASYVGNVVPLGSDYAIASIYADNCTQGGGCVLDTGAWTLGSATRGLHGRIGPGNSLLGTVSGEGPSQRSSFNSAADQLVVGRPLANTVSLLERSLFKDGFD